MNMQINLLSIDALDAVSGGRPNIISEGNVPIAGSSTATGTQIGGGGGTSSGGSGFWGDLLRGAEIAGAVGLVTAAAVFG
jgi:hypothetical protein